MKKKLLIIIGFTLLTATTGCIREHIPDNLLDTSTMRAIMEEYYLIDGYDYMVASRYPDSLGFQSNAAKDSLLKKHSISQTDYDSSLAYYTRHPKVFEQIMERVIANMTARCN